MSVADSKHGERLEEIRLRVAENAQGMYPHQTVEFLLSALEAAEADARRLQHIVECADTPLMRDVLAERDIAMAALRDIEWVVQTPTLESVRDRAYRAMSEIGERRALGRA